MYGSVLLQGDPLANKRRRHLSTSVNFIFSAHGGFVICPHAHQEVLRPEHSAMSDFVYLGSHSPILGFLLGLPIAPFPIGGPMPEPLHRIHTVVYDMYNFRTSKNKYHRPENDLNIVM
jgi:hypothetical protein